MFPSEVREPPINKIIVGGRGVLDAMGGGQWQSVRGGGQIEKETSEFSKEKGRLPNGKKGGGGPLPGMSNGKSERLCSWVSAPNEKEEVRLGRRNRKSNILGGKKVGS